jgi:hypothetical protein
LFEGTQSHSERVIIRVAIFFIYNLIISFNWIIQDTLISKLKLSRQLGGVKPYADTFREVLKEIDYIDEVDKIVSFILKERIRKEVTLAQLSRDQMGMPMNFDKIEVYAQQVDGFWSNTLSRSSHDSRQRSFIGTSNSQEGPTPMEGLVFGRLKP